MLIDDFNKVINVLNSCKTEEHLIHSNRYYELFLKKWENNIPDKLRLTLMFTYVRLQKAKVYELTKNKYK